MPANVRAAELLPGHLAARRAALVISNGGASTSYQALAEGRPVIGLPFNLDQYLAMTAIARTGAGLLLRAGSATAAQVRAAVRRVLGEPGYRRAAEEVSRELAAYDAPARFRAFVDEVCGEP